MAIIQVCSECGKKNRYAHEENDTLCAKCMDVEHPRQTVKIKLKKREEAGEE